MESPVRKVDPAQAERLHKFAHDLRNRLAAIQQVLHHLSAPGTAAERGELGTFGEQQYFKAMRHMEELLDDLGVDRTPRLSAPTTVVLDELVRKAVNTMSHRPTRKEQEVVVRLQEGVTVMGDAHHLSDIVSALVSNASKFSPRGTTIRVELHTEGAEALLTVGDEGIGLDAEDLESVFVRYAWLKGRSTDGEAQGRGTLARSRQLAQAHGGELQVQSAGPGAGSTFTLRLPLSGQAS